MMRKLLVLFLMALYAGTAWATGGGSTTTYYAALKAQVSSGSSGMGKVYAGTSQTAGTYNDSSSTATANSTTKDASKTFYAFAQANDGYEFKGWSTSDNGTDLGTASPISQTVKCSSTSSGSPTTTTLYATFAEKVLPAFDVTFQTGSDGIYTVNGATPANLSGLTRATKVTLASSDPTFFAWSINGERVYDNPYEKTFTSAATVGAVFLTADKVATVATYDELAAALANDAYLKVVVQADAVIAVDAGKTLNVSEGKQLVNEGTLFVEGNLNNSGTISGGGTISTCARLFTQENKNGEWGPTAEPVYSWPSPKVVYWVTTMQSDVGKVNGVSGALKHVTFRNGRGSYIRTTPNSSVPLVLGCTVDSGIAMNHVTAIAKTFASGLDAYNGGYSSGFKVVTGAASYAAEANNKFSHSWGITDCAGNQVTLSNELGGGSAFKFLNGKVKISGSIQATDSYFINCTSVSASSYHSDKTKVQHLRFFDTTGISISGSKMGTGGDGAAFYSGTYDDTLSDFAKCKVYASTDENGRVYGGVFKKDPNEYLADAVNYEAKQRASDNYWVVQIKKPLEYVAVSDGVEYEDLSEAISKSTSGIITLKKHVELEEPVTVPEGKSITLELAGYNITGAAGVFVNNGTLTINDGSHNDLPSTVSATSGNLFVNNGTMEITCGTYSGAVLLNGGNFITHGGTFNVTLVAGTGVTDKSAVADFRGGQFKTDSLIAETTEAVEAATWFSGGFLDPGYVAVPHEGMLWVGYGTYATAREITLSSTDKAWELTALSAADQALYVKNPTTREECANDAEWRRFLELQSMINPYKGKVIDCVLVFDRAIVSGSISAKVASFSMSLDEDIPANTQYSALIPRITQYQIQYSRFVYDPDGIYDDLKLGIKNNSVNNIGTTCTIYLYLKTQTRDQNIGGVWTYTYHNFRPIAAETVTFTGKGAIFGDTDYTSLAAALIAANYSGTVLLSKDCTEQVPVSRATSFVLDTNSFAFTGAITVGDGFELTTEDLGDGKTRYTVAPAAVAQVGADKYTSLEDALEAAQTSGEPVLVLGPVPETPPEGFASIEVGGRTLLVPEAAPEVVVQAPVAANFPEGAPATAKDQIVAAGPVAVITGTGVLDEDVCSDASVLAALQAVEELTEAERAQITATSEIRRYVSVQLTAVEVTAAAAFAGLSFDVKPMAKTFVIDAAGAVKVVVAQIPNEELKGGITFRLPLTDAFTVGARIVHAGDQDRLVRVEKATDGTRYATVTATHFSIFTAYPDSHVESAVSSSNVLAVKRVPGGTAAEVVAAVPWKNVALTGDVTVDRLIATGVATGDEIAAWNHENKTYYTWCFNGTAWESATDARTGVVAPAASETTLTRGQAVWYKRATPSEAYSQIGGYTAEAVETTVTQGGKTLANKPANTLLINPYYEAVDLAKISGSHGDQIQVLPSLKVYSCNNGQWGVVELVTVDSPFGPIKQQKFNAVSSIVLPAGQGFWYISKGGQPTIDWKSIKPTAE